MDYDPLNYKVNVPPPRPLEYYHQYINQLKCKLLPKNKVIKMWFNPIGRHFGKNPIVNIKKRN